MIPLSSAIRLRIVCIQILTLLAMAPGELRAVQIAPNPNPQFNTITIPDPLTGNTLGENRQNFLNLGEINVKSSPGPGSIIAGELDNFGVFTNRGLVQSGDGASIVNAVPGQYHQEAGTTLIRGRFINLGEVRIDHGTSFIFLGQGQTYLQQTGSTSNSGLFSATGTVDLDQGTRFTNSRDGVYIQQSGGGLGVLNHAVFTNLGQVELNNPFHNNGVYSNEPGGKTYNNSVYQQDNSGITYNSGRFINAQRVQVEFGSVFLSFEGGQYVQRASGSTNVDGQFINRATVSSVGQMNVGPTGQYTQEADLALGRAVKTYNGGTFANLGRVDIGAGTTFINRFTGPTGGVYQQQSVGTTLVNGNFINRGQVSNEGAITIGATGQYHQQAVPGSNRAAFTVNTGTFTNAGTVRIGEGTSFSNFSDRASSVAQYLQQASGTTRIDGTFQNAGARVENAGSMTIGSTGTYLQAFNKFVPVVSTTVNTGTFTNAGSTLINGGTFTNHGSVVNSGTFQIGVNGAGTLTNQGTVVNAGKFEVGTLGQVAGNGSYVQNAAAAQTIVNGTFAHNISLQAGSLSGTGTIADAVMNTGGVVQPGSSIVPGTLTLANYTQGVYGRLDLKIGGLLAGSQYDVLKVTGTGTFGGSLSVSLINGFTPGLGNRFDLLTCSLGCSGLNGGTLFSGGVSLPSLASGLAWVSGLTDGGTSFSFTVVASAASAPEPGMLLLVGSGLIVLLGWRRRQPVHTIGQ